LYVEETGFDHVGFWPRVLEYIIDAVAIYIVVLIVAFPLVANLSAATQQWMADTAQLGQSSMQTITPQMAADSALVSKLSGEVSLIWMLVSVLDFVVLQGARGQSLGKMVMGHHLVGRDGSLPKPGVIIGRFFAFWLSSFLFDVGFMMAGWNRKRQALHDMLCGTYVIRKRRTRP
jgi:uncharacterized RDD family membrane protein YckC